MSPETPVSVPSPDLPPLQCQWLNPLYNQTLARSSKKALDAIQFRKRAKLEKIVKSTALNGRITNDQVEKLLRVSDATATRYLSQLVKEGRLKRVGPYGNARYEPVGGSNGEN